VVAAFYINFYLERNWFSATRLDVSYFLCLVTVLSVAISYIIVFSSPEMTASPGVYLSTNTFLLFCTIALFPHCFYTQKLGLEKFLLATRSDGGEAAEILVKKGEEVDLDEQNNSSNESTSGNGVSTRGRSALASLALRRQTAANGTSNTFEEDEADRDIQEQFGSIMSSLSEHDIERVVSSTSAARDKSLEEQKNRHIQQKFETIRRDRNNKKFGDLDVE